MKATPLLLIECAFLNIYLFEKKTEEKVWAVLVFLIFPSLITDNGDSTIYLHSGVLSYHFELHFKLTTYRQYVNKHQENNFDFVSDQTCANRGKKRNKYVPGV